MECRIADETSVPLLNCECFASAASGQQPSWVHTGLTASKMNVRCHTKHENEGRSLTCSSSSHQESVSADDKSKDNKPPFIPRTNLLTLTLYTSHSGSSFGYRCIAVTTVHAVCIFFGSVSNFRWREAAQLISPRCLKISVTAAISKSWLRFCQEGTFPAI